MPSTIDDRAVFERTTTSAPDDRGLVVTEFVLPSGRRCQSPPIQQVELNGRWWITWANDIRAQDEADKTAKASEDTAKAIARRENPERSLDVLMASDASALPSKEESSPTSSSALPDDPNEMIRAKVLQMKETLSEHQNSQKRLQNLVKECRQNLEKWLIMVENLGIDLTPVPTTEDRVPSPDEFQPGYLESLSELVHDEDSPPMTEKTPRKKPKPRRRTARKPRVKKEKKT